MKRLTHMAVVAMAVALLGGACTTNAVKSTPSSTSSPVVTVVPSAPPTASLGATPQPMPTADGDTSLGAGTYAFDFTRLDTPGNPFPRVLVTVPDGWSGFRGFGVDSLGGVDNLGGSRFHFVSFWDVVDVYKNPCHWLGPKVHPGPTVDELAAMLAAQPLRKATVPVAVSLGGYHGKYLEQSIPKGLAFSNCDKDPSDGQFYFESWTGNVLWNAPYDTTDRHEQGPGQVDRIWILDVEGRRFVIDASYMPGATAQDKADVQQVVDSIRFQP
jgi:hypothetical protein